MDYEKEEKELVPVRVKSKPTSGEEEVFDNTPDPAETEQQIIPRRWYVF